MLPKPHLALLAALLAAWGASWLSGRMDAYHVHVLMLTGINVILAVSLNLVNGHTGQFSLGHAGFMSVGAYGAAAVSLFVAPWMLGSGAGAASASGALFPVALLAGGLAAALAGLLVGVPSLRLRGDYLAIVTLGFGQIIKVLLENCEPLGGALGLNGIPLRTTVFWVLAGAALAVFTVGCLVRSTYGRGFLAVRDDEVAAAAIGLDPARYKITAFVVGAFFAGLAGGLYAHLVQSITPGGFDFTKSIEIVVMVILGGMGRTLGVVLAAVLLTVLTEALRPVAEYRVILYSLLLIGLMLVRPQGLFNFKSAKTKP